jgi:hypothetical protein
MQGSSSWDQKSTSYDQDEIYSMPLNDKYVFFFNEYWTKQKKKRKRVSIGEMTKHLDFKKLEANVL